MFPRLIRSFSAAWYLSAQKGCKQAIGTPCFWLSTSSATNVWLVPSISASSLFKNHLAYGSRPSLAARATEFPEVIRQWHPEKNLLRPEGLTPFSKKKIWFICDEGHEWVTHLYQRTRRGDGCPTCNRKRVTSTNTLLAKCPKVAAEWHPTKNGEVTTKDVAHGSGRKVWWQCGQGHEWEAHIIRRTHATTGCPECAHARRVGAPKVTQSLLNAHPNLAQQWHPTKNGVLTPDAVSRASDKKVWWQC
eukprot:Colp12_sorted_trinity150504_noHs@2